MRRRRAARQEGAGGASRSPNQLSADPDSAPDCHDPRSNGWQLSDRDQALLLVAERGAEIPPVEPRAAHGRAEIEPGGERRDDGIQRMQVRPVLINELLR